MRHYTPKGATPEAKVRDLANEATAHGEATVGDVSGFSVVAWPGDGPEAVFRAYEDIVRLNGPGTETALTEQELAATKAAEEAADRDGAAAMGDSFNWNIYWKEYWAHYWTHYREALSH